jgi:hypothetical protein
MSDSNICRTPDMSSIKSVGVVEFLIDDKGRVVNATMFCSVKMVTGKVHRVLWLDGDWSHT